MAGSNFAKERQKMKKASLGIFSRLKGEKEYECKFPWAEDCYCQGGDDGIVFSKNKDSYRTAFFEAFPRNPDTFIRGEGKTIEEAEEKAWNKFQKYNACSNHEFERKGYTNGAGFCKHCGLFKSKCFEPTTLCSICNKPTDYGLDKLGNHFCEEHYSLIKEENMFSWQLDELKSKESE